MSFSLPASWRSLSAPFAIAGALAIAALSGCTPPPPPPLPVVRPEITPVAPHPQEDRQSGFLRLPNMGAGRTPVRVGIILPFSSNSPAVRGLANSMVKAAELALFDSHNHDILLMTADEGAGPADAAAAASHLLDQGAEVIVGPLFGPSVTAVAPLARDHGVPVLAFSTEKSVAGNGVYLLSFLPQSEVRRVISYAASQGRTNFAALIPQTAYGDVVDKAFVDSVQRAKGRVADIERFPASADAVMEPVGQVAKAGADAIFIAQGGAVLRAIAPDLAFDGIDHNHVRLLGTGLWDDSTLTRESTLYGGWFAAPEPDADAEFNAKYHDTFGAPPPPLASLAYDAISLVALLAPGAPYHRFTASALDDPNGFAGVNGIFRFNSDGTSERGLAVLEVTPDGFKIVSPAPKTFQKPGS
jgi:ABC-type branched-subunit amino acid transport system substrate-binding protein